MNLQWLKHLQVSASTLCWFAYFPFDVVMNYIKQTVEAVSSPALGCVFSFFQHVWPFTETHKWKYSLMWWSEISPDKQLVTHAGCLIVHTLLWLLTNKVMHQSAHLWTEHLWCDVMWWLLVQRQRHLSQFQNMAAVVAAPQTWCMSQTQVWRSVVSQVHSWDLVSFVCYVTGGKSWSLRSSHVLEKISNISRCDLTLNWPEFLLSYCINIDYDRLGYHNPAAVHCPVPPLHPLMSCIKL